MVCQNAQGDAANDRLEVIVVGGGDGSEERSVYSHSSSLPLESVGGIERQKQTQHHNKQL